MKRISHFLAILFLITLGVSHAEAQKPDSSKSTKVAVQIYFIINAGEEINAYYHDKPLQLSTIDEFNNYIQTNAKSMRESWVVVTGKPKTGTYDEVMKTLKRNKFKHITSNITN